jgi:hypothetical protein
MMAVQLDEAREFLARDTVAHDRLAFILLDNAAEVIMRRYIEVKLSPNMFWERLRDRWKEILAKDPGNAEARRQLDEVNREIVSKRARKSLTDKFDAKVDFICTRGHIQESEARVLKKLHWYRNELYHRDHIRPQTIRSACLLYFDMTCDLFEGLQQSQDMILTMHYKAPLALRKFSPSGTDRYPEVGEITAWLRAGLGIDDVSLREALSAHLEARLDALEATVSRARDLLFGTLPEIATTLPWRQLVVHLAQWKEEQLPGSFEELLAAEVKYSEADLANWKQMADGLQNATSRVEQFEMFADTEDAFEPFEELMATLELRINLEIEHEVDLMRGK